MAHLSTANIVLRLGAYAIASSVMEGRNLPMAAGAAGSAGPRLRPGPLSAGLRRAPDGDRLSSRHGRCVGAFLDGIASCVVCERSGQGVRVALDERTGGAVPDG